MAMMLVEHCVLPHHGLVLLGLCLEITRDMLTHTFQCIQDIILLEMELSGTRMGIIRSLDVWMMSSMSLDTGIKQGFEFLIKVPALNAYTT